MPDAFLEQRLRAALQAPVTADPLARDRIMMHVREAARSRTPASRTLRLRPRHSIAGLALAAGLGSVAALGSLGDLAHAARPVTSRGVVSGPARDTLIGSLLDTMHLVGQWSGGGSPVMERRYAIAVDMTRFVPDPAALRVRGDDGRVYTLLHSARASD